jgi:uncharacterized protein YbbC (DUF1343 family)
MRYELPIAPSPALVNMRAVYLYPSLCYFEATKVSVGRGGEAPFQMLTYPDGTVVDLRSDAPGAPSDDEVIARGIDLTYLLDAYRAHRRSAAGGARFLSPFFEKLIGVDWVRGMIAAGNSADEIRAHWRPDVERFKRQRYSYLIYE